MSTYAVRGLSRLLRSLKQRCLIIGEVHGARVNPATLRALLGELINRGENVTLALEWRLSTAAASSLQRYIGGVEPEKALLRRSTFYVEPSGKFSQQHLGFLRWLRRYVAGRAVKVNVIAFDSWAPSWAVREAAMAQRIRSLLRRLPRGQRLVVVTGILHARRRAFEVDGEQHLPMAARLPARAVASIALRYDGGRVYNFGLREVRSLDSQQPAALRYYHDAVVRVGRAVPVQPLSR